MDRNRWNGSEETRDRFRDFFRADSGVFPSGFNGFVLSDIDYVARQFRHYQASEAGEQRLRAEIEARPIMEYCDPAVVDEIIDFNRMLDPDGVFRFIEMKHIANGTRSRSNAQARTFSLIDTVLQGSMSEGHRYRGFYLLDMSDPWPPDAEHIYINGVRSTVSDVIRLMACLTMNVPAWSDVEAPKARSDLEIAS